MSNWNSNNDPEHLSNLINHDNPEAIDWNAVIQRVESHRKEVKLAALYGTTFINRILRLNPPGEAVRAVIRAHPYALVRGGLSHVVGNRIFIPLDSDGARPLQLACMLELSPDIVRTILQECIRAANNNERRSRVELNTVVRDVYFWDLPIQYFRVFMEELPRSFHTRQSESIMHCDIKRLASDPNAWEKINLALMVINGVSERERFQVLHAFLELSHDAAFDSVRQVNAILRVIKDNAPEQFRTRDDRGLLPLQIAIQPLPSRTARRIDGTRSERFAPFSTIRFLVDAYPEAVGIPDEQGRLPLHVAAQHGMPFVHILAKAEPRALATRSVETHLYPFQLAALSLPSQSQNANDFSVGSITASEWSDSDSVDYIMAAEWSDSDSDSNLSDSENEDEREAEVVDVTFKLLRMAPDVIRSLTGA